MRSYGATAGKDVPMRHLAQPGYRLFAVERKTLEQRKIGRIHRLFALFCYLSFAAYLICSHPTRYLVALASKVLAPWLTHIWRS